MSRKGRACKVCRWAGKASEAVRHPVKNWPTCPECGGPLCQTTQVGLRTRAPYKPPRR